MASKPRRPLRAALAERTLSPRHAQDLLHAFRMDAVKTALRQFRRADALLRLFGGARRALRSRCAWRERGRHGPPMTRSARPCRSSTIFRIAAPIIAISTASIFRSMRWRRKASMSTALAAAKASPDLLACLHELAGAHRVARPSKEATLPRQVQRSPAVARDRGDRRALRRRLVTLAASARSVERKSAFDASPSSRLTLFGHRRRPASIASGGRRPAATQARDA